jgi:hypothetical protein
MWLLTLIFLAYATNNPSKREKVPLLPILVERIPVDSQALVEYAHYHHFPLLFSLPKVQTQGTAIHISTEGLWLTAAHVVGGAFDIYLLNENEKMKVDIVGMDAQKDIAILAISTPYFHPVVKPFDLRNPIKEESIQASGFRFGESTSSFVKNIHQDDTEPGILLWEGQVEAGMSGGLLWQPSTNEMLGMILSYEPSNNISRAISVQWIVEHFQSLLHPSLHDSESHEKTFLKKEECSHQKMGFIQHEEGLQIVSLSTNTYNLGLQIGDVMTDITDTVLTCDMFPVSQTKTFIVERSEHQFYWIAHPF